MGLLERLQPPTTTADPAPLLAPSPWQLRRRPSGSLLLQPLGKSGLVLRDPGTGRGVPQERLDEMGAVVTPLLGITSLRNDERRDASTPGEELTFIANGGRVELYSGDGSVRVGELEPEIARHVTEARALGAELRVISLWETASLGGRRTGLDVLIVPTSVELILAVE